MKKKLNKNCLEILNAREPLDELNRLANSITEFIKTVTMYESALAEENKTGTKCLYNHLINALCDNVILLTEFAEYYEVDKKEIEKICLNKTYLTIENIELGGEKTKEEIIELLKIQKENYVQAMSARRELQVKYVECQVEYQKLQEKVAVMLDSSDENAKKFMEAKKENTRLKTLCTKNGIDYSKKEEK